MTHGWHVRTLFHDEEWSMVLRRDPCVYCGSRGGTVEHVDPRGPRSPVINGVGACLGCNQERGSVPLIYYLLWRHTDRSEAFTRWNFRLNAPAIRKRQLITKSHRRRVYTPEPQAPPLRVSIAELTRFAAAVDPVEGSDHGLTTRAQSLSSKDSP